MDSTHFFCNDTNSNGRSTTKPKKIPFWICGHILLIVTFAPMKNQVCIRQATVEDAQAILSLIQELATFERKPEAVIPVSYTHLTLPTILLV